MIKVFIPKSCSEILPARPATFSTKQDFSIMQFKMGMADKRYKAITNYYIL
jgi:hypothetical protein